MEKLGSKVKLPLYNQPSDTTVYQENRSRHSNMKTRLVSRLRKEHSNRTAIRHEASRTYARLVQEWHRKVEKLESTQKRKTKDAKNREFFEKVFPELRKQREDKERFNRVGARIKSEADLEEIMDGLQEQEVYSKFFLFNPTMLLPFFLLLFFYIYTESSFILHFGGLINQSSI